MPRYIVHGRLKPAKKAELAARLKDGTLAQGTRRQDALLSALQSGHATGDDAYFFLDAESPDIPEEKEALAGYLDIVNVVPEDNMAGPELATLQSYDPLPEWAGVD